MFFTASKAQLAVKKKEDTWNSIIQKILILPSVTHRSFEYPCFKLRNHENIT